MALNVRLIFKALLKINHRSKRMAGALEQISTDIQGLTEAVNAQTTLIQQVVALAKPVDLSAQSKAIQDATTALLASNAALQAAVTANSASA